MITRFGSLLRLVHRNWSPLYINPFFKASQLVHSTGSLQTSEESGGYYEFTGPIPQDRLEIKFARSSGPGGQNVNKVNTKVELRFHVESAEWIPEKIRSTLLQREKNRINKIGELVVTSTKSHSQQKNIEDGMSRLHGIIKDASYVPRTASKEQQQHVRKLAKRFNERRLRDKSFSAVKKRERRNDQ